MKRHKRIISIVAFVFLLAAIALPFRAAIHESSASDALITLAIIALVLAIVFGFLGRCFLLGRIAWIGALILCMIGAVNYVRFRSAADESETRLRLLQDVRSGR